MTRNAKKSGAKGLRSKFRVLWRVFVLGLLLLVLACAAALPALHRVARSFVLSRLHDAGYEASSLGELRIGMTGCVFRNVLVSDGTGPGVRIRRLDISYPLALPPRLDRVGIRISGASVRLRETESAWVVEGVPIPADAGYAAEFGFPSLPVSFLDWSDVAVTVATRRFGEQQLRLEGRLQEGGGSSLSGEGAVGVGAGVNVHGQFRLDRLDGTLGFRLRTDSFNARAASFGWPDTAGFATLGFMAVDGDIVLSETLEWTGQGGGSLEVENLFASLPNPEGGIVSVGLDRVSAQWSAAESAADSAFAAVDLEVEGLEASARGHTMQLERLSTKDVRLPLPPMMDGGKPAVDSAVAAWVPTGKADIRGLVVDGSRFSAWQLELAEEGTERILRIPELSMPRFSDARLSDLELRAPATIAGAWSAEGLAHLPVELVARRIPADSGIELVEDGKIRFRAQALVENADNEWSIRTLKTILADDALRVRWNGIDAQASLMTEVAARLSDQTVEASAKTELSLDGVDSEIVQMDEAATLLVEVPAVRGSVEEWLDWCRGPGRLPGGDPVAVDVKAGVPQLRIPQRQLELSDIRLSVPLAWHGGAEVRSAGTVPGTLSAGSCRWLGRTLQIEPVTLRVADHSAEVEGAVSVGEAENPIIQVDGRATAGWRSDPGVEANLRLRTSQLEDARGMAAQATGMALPEPDVLSGDVELTVAASVEEGRGVRTSGTLSLQDIHFELDEPPVVVQRLSGEIELTDLIAVRTASHQRLSFASALFGSIPVDGGQLAFQVESPELLFLERCEMSWCGGTVTTHAVQVRPAEQNIEVTFFVDGVHLAELFQLQTLVVGRAEGLLYGQLPFRYLDGNISFQNGYLYSPPGIPGILQLDDAEALFAGLPKDSPRITVVKQTLKDMEYDYLRLDINTRDELTPLKISLLGHARNDPTLRAVKLNANIESDINDLLDMTRAMKRLNLTP